MTDTYLIRLRKGTAVNDSKCLFEHDPSPNEDHLPLQQNSIFYPVM
jgi:hypothetical protein